jgi:hypothetical protein
MRSSDARERLIPVVWADFGQVTAASFSALSLPLETW